MQPALGVAVEAGGTIVDNFRAAGPALLLAGALGAEQPLVFVDG